MSDRDDERAQAEQHAYFIEIMDRLVRDQRVADLNAEKDQRIAALRAEVARLRGEAKMVASDIVERLSLQRYYPRCTTAEQRIAELEADNAELRADAERYRWLETQMTWRDRDAWHGELQPALPEREWFHVTDSDLYPLSAMIDAALRQRVEQESEG